MKLKYFFFLQINFLFKQHCCCQQGNLGGIQTICCSSPPGEKLPRKKLKIDFFLEMWQSCKMSQILQIHLCNKNIGSWFGWRRRSLRAVIQGFTTNWESSIYERKTVQVVGGTSFKHHLLCKTSIPKGDWIVNYRLKIEIKYRYVKFVLCDIVSSFCYMALIQDKKASSVHLFKRIRSKWINVCIAYYICDASGNDYDD